MRSHAPIHEKHVCCLHSVFILASILSRQRAGNGSRRAALPIPAPQAGSGKHSEAIPHSSTPLPPSAGGDALHPEAYDPLPDKYLFSIGAQATVGQFNYPWGVTVRDRTGCMWRTPRIIASSGSPPQVCSLGQWGAGGGGGGSSSTIPGAWRQGRMALCTWRTPTTTASNGSLPRGCRGEVGDAATRTDSSGTVPAACRSGRMVTCTWRMPGNHRIQRFTAAWRALGKWGAWGGGDGQFVYPFGVAAGGDGTVYVADTDNNRIPAVCGDGRVPGEVGHAGQRTRAILPSKAA